MIWYHLLVIGLTCVAVGSYFLIHEDHPKKSKHYSNIRIKEVVKGDDSGRFTTYGGRFPPYLLDVRTYDKGDREEVIKNIIKDMKLKKANLAEKERINATKKVDWIEDDELMIEQL